MKAAAISTTIGVVTVLGFGFAAAEYIQAHRAEIEQQIAQVDERAKQYSSAAYRGAIRTHAADYWRGEVERQKRYLQYLRASRAEDHEIRDAERALDYYQQEHRAAQKALSEQP